MATELLTAAMPGMMEHAYNPSMWEAKVGGLQRIGGQSGKHSRTLSQRKLGRKKYNNKIKIPNPLLSFMCAYTKATPD